MVRNEIPLEAITSEQFEIGGGTAHDAWSFFNAYSRKKVRTGGWAEKNNTDTDDLARWTGVVTLGSIDDSTAGGGAGQVYYQQVDTTTAKVDFTFSGVVNEGLQVYRDDDQDVDFAENSDYTRLTYLKLFVRKKGRTYAGSQISDIGVDSINTIVNRFPLTHATDAAITITDGELLGTAPYRTTSLVTLASGVNGVQTTGRLYDSATETFQTKNVAIGDTLRVISGTNADVGYYEITSVPSETQLQVKEMEDVANTNDFTFTTDWANVATSSGTFTVHSRQISSTVAATGAVTALTADTGIVETGTVGVGTITHVGETWTTSPIVEAGDMLILANGGEEGFLSNATNAGTDIITTTANHEFITGERVQYDLNGMTDDTGLTDGTIYYVNVASATTLSLHTTAAFAFAATPKVDLTAGAAETHNLISRDLDGVYRILDSNTTGASDPVDTILYVDTTDQPWPALVRPNAQYTIEQPGMFLQFKDNIIDIPQTVTNINFGDDDSDTITITGGVFDNTLIAAGDMAVVANSEDVGAVTAPNDGRYTIVSATATVLTLIADDTLTENATDTTATIDIRRGFTRTIGSNVNSFRWRVGANTGTLANVFQFVQHELRGTNSNDVDYSYSTSTGNITDLLMTFASPTGVALDLIIDNLATSDVNNATYNDHSGTARTFPFTSSGNLVFNTNLVDDTAGKYWMYFANDDAGVVDLGRDYGTKDALLVNDADGTAITGFVNGTSSNTDHNGENATAHGTNSRIDSANNVSIPFTYDYDNNVQRGNAAAATAAVTLVAIGLVGGQFVVASGTITRATGLTISAVAALERNYSNPA